MTDLQPETERFLILGLRARWDTQALDQTRALADGDSLDWAAVQEAALQARVAPLLYHTLSNRHILPSPVEQGFQIATYANDKHNLLLFSELQVVLALLKTEGVPAILLKGSGLTVSVYHNESVRPMEDIDLLVRRQDVPRTLRVLAAQGFRRAQVETHAGAAMIEESQILVQKSDLIDTSIEVHWSLFDSPYYQHKLSMDWFWQTARPAAVGESPALVLSAEAQILHLCGHLFLHHSGTELLWLHDVAETIVAFRQKIDWEQLLAQAQACDLVLPLQNVLTDLADRWIAPVPESVLARLRDLRPSEGEKRVFAWLTAEQRPVAQRFWADLMSTPSWRLRLRFAFTNLFPSRAYMRQRYRITRPLLLPFYYPYRLLSGLAGLVENWTTRGQPWK